MRSFVLLAVLGLVFPSITRADEEPTTADLPVAVVDVLHIFKNHEPVIEKMEPLKRDVQELEHTVQLRQVEIEQLQRKLASPPRPGEDRNEMQMQFARLQTELRTLIERERQNLQRREMAIQVEFYKQIQQQVQRIAKERKIKLVMVRPRVSIDSQDPQEVARALNQPILFEDGLDITDEVLAALRSQPATGEQP